MVNYFFDAKTLSIDASWRKKSTIVEDAQGNE